MAQRAAVFKSCNKSSSSDKPSYVLDFECAYDYALCDYDCAFNR